MTIKETLATAAQNLKKSKTKFPHLEAEILLSHALNRSREYVLAHPEVELTKTQVLSFKFQVLRRLRGWPAAYLMGEKEFYGLKFFVNKDVLIPRPETELMVEEAMKLVACNLKLETCNLNRVTIIDVGTGSGCIIITLAKFFQGFGLYATDISDEALSVAKKNAKLHGINKKINFFKGNLLEPLPSFMFQDSCFKIITANLPYLTPTQIKNSPTIKYEPKLALSAGADGLKYYRRLFEQIKKHKLRNSTLLCEIDPTQQAKIKQLAGKKLPPHTLEIKKDLAGLKRLAVIKF